MLVLRREIARPKSAAACVAQSLAISASVVAAAVDIETIVATGAVFSLTGLVIAGVGWFRLRSPRMAILGLSTPALSLAVFLWIVLMEWGPGAAQTPVTMALICFELIMLPVGLWALWGALSGGASARDKPRIQFSVRSLLVATLIAAISLAIARICGNRDVQKSLAVGLFVLTALASAAVIARRVFIGRAGPNIVSDRDSRSVADQLANTATTPPRDGDVVV